MNDLQLHHQLQNENETLKRENDRLNRRLTEWKHKYKKLRGTAQKQGEETRTDKALAQIRTIKDNGFDGTVISQIRQVAKDCFISESHAADLWYKR